jgi:hypothetical protein
MVFSWIITLVPTGSDLKIQDYKYILTANLALQSKLVGDGCMFFIKELVRPNHLS